MKITFEDISTDSHKYSGDTIVYFASRVDSFSGSLAKADDLSGGAIKIAAAAARFKAKSGQSFEILAPVGLDASRVLVIGIGDEVLTHQEMVELGGGLAAKLLPSGARAAHIVAEGVDAVAVAEGALLRSYRFDKYRTKEPDSKKPTLSEITVGTVDDQAATAFEARRAVVEGVFLTRDLVSEPSNILHPESFADEARKLTEIGIDVEVLGEKEMTKLGMGSLLGVGQGSRRESQLAIMRWNGSDDKDAQPIAFIGKGVTFDTGGISIKPSAGMEQMKWDMGGAGTVVGLMKALAGRKANVNVVATIGLVENMPDGNAQRPGDVVTSMSGQTIEVINTDAEGRLVLADALWYTQDRFKPSQMIDLATLTGAIIVSLGNEHAGIFTDSDDISAGLAKAGYDTGDKVWRLPLHKAYDKQINCDVADMQNVGGKGAGSITAAQFLKRFTNDVPWCHIDIAGTVWSSKDLPLSEKGGTGFGVRMLDKYVADNFEA